MEKEKLICRIIDIEWKMFSSVENEGGPAPCQEDSKTFEIMRRSQFQTWSFEVLNSYHGDLKRAWEKGENLCTYKYAYMMEFTCPQEYGRLEAHLPGVGKDTLEKIREIVAVNLSWERECADRYPRLRSRGRPTYKERDSEDAVSAETYLFCELKTYSPETIDLLHEYTLLCQKEHINLVTENMKNMVLAYGFGSLEQAEG